MIFGLLIFFHELGHFLLAKRAGIRVNEFSLGLGPTIWGIQKGETKDETLLDHGGNSFDDFEYAGCCSVSVYQFKVP